MAEEKPYRSLVKAISWRATGTCDTFDVCGTSKKVCLASEIGKDLTALKAAVGTIYPAFFCGVPTSEPSCVPARPAAVDGSTIYTGVPSATDGDGDGVATATDNCPTVFNPVRPMDKGKQADADGDGVGDACDLCPLDANKTDCTKADPNDTDRDGIPNATDNCADKANADQKDTDGDKKGDVCDACPAVANPGNQACPASIYDIKAGVVAVGTAVSLTGTASMAAPSLTARAKTASINSRVTHGRAASWMATNSTSGRSFARAFPTEWNRSAPPTTTSMPCKARCAP